MRGAERLPVEGGEKRRENAEKPREEDRESDHLEWCLREYVQTLSKMEEPIPRKSTEEPMVLIDGFMGKVTEAEKEEARKSDYEKTPMLTIGSEHTTIHENQKAVNKPATGSGTVEAFRTKECRTDADGKTQSANEGPESSHGRDGDHHREAERGRADLSEPSQTSEQRQNNSECGKRSETLTTERSHPDQDKESDPRAEQDTKHQEEAHSSPKLGESPKAFIEANRELLMKEEMTIKDDEARLGDKTLLKLDANEGLTIIHENKRYRIATVEQEKIGDLELRRYKTSQGEEFIHISREKTAIPPYETPWYALPTTTEISLDKEYKHELLEAAIHKAGGQGALGQELEERGTHIGNAYLSVHLHDRVDGMRVDKLVPILTYLDRNLNEPSSHITAVGKYRAVENPILPFKLDNIDGARLHAARFSDGSLSVCQGQGSRFEYRNNDAEQRNRVVESLSHVFGRANILKREYDDGRVSRVRATTDIIGYVLQRSGAVTGEITTRNPDIPTFILQGSREMKREWLKQAFGDEGSTWPQRGLVTLQRSVDAAHRLSDEQRNRLDILSIGWKRRPQADWWRGEPTRYCMFDELPKVMRKALSLERPRLLDSEARMLYDDFGIKTKVYPRSINTREGGYGVSWMMQTASREDGRRFYNEIGFPQNGKQERLKSMLRIRKGDNH